MSNTDSRLPASFRDPNGFLFHRESVLYRQVNLQYKATYRRLMESGLYAQLTGDGLLIPHESTAEAGTTDTSYLVIKPAVIPLWSYPYEWSFSQLKDAALLTLDIQTRALAHGLSLQDASAYNVQYHAGKPIFIDTLSFEMYSEGAPWAAYRQFCQHFLAPLALMCHTDIRLHKLFINYIDGIPLDLASKLLPLKTKLTPSLGLHIHLHARQQTRSGDKSIDKQKLARSMSKHALLALIDSLQSSIDKLHWQPQHTEWHNYYADNHNYAGASLSQKESIVAEFIVDVNPTRVLDLGANDGRFSRIASQYAEYVISCDIDPGCVENNYRMVKQRAETRLLPLLIDISNPSPAIGWAHRERNAFMPRGRCDVVLALGLIHHLAIANNLPLAYIADFFQQLGRYVIVEFIPKQDSQVVKLLTNRVDIFPDYTQTGFESAFGQYFTIEKIQSMEDSLRTIYLMKASG